uniref:Bm13082 n=1 Tax=Brugia malayi TaxID=6279 RepID=A0A7I4K7H8_BRUMA
MIIHTYIALSVQNDGEVQGLLLLFKWQRCVTLKLIRILWT